MRVTRLLITTDFAPNLHVFQFFFFFIVTCRDLVRTIITKLIKFWKVMEPCLLLITPKCAPLLCLPPTAP